MSNDIFTFNTEFVEKKEYLRFATDKFPNKKIAILTCMDTRLVELLPAAMGYKNGDIKILKNAGGIISHPFGSVIRSLIIAIYELGVDTILESSDIPTAEWRILMSATLLKRWLIEVSNVARLSI